MPRLPDEPTTPEQWQVIAWTCFVLFAALGAVGFYYAGNAPPDKAELANALRAYSGASWALAAGIYVAMRLIKLWLG